MTANGFFGPKGPDSRTGHGSAQARVLRCRVVPGEMRTLRYWPVVLGALLALVGLVPAATVAADSASSLRERATRLSQQNADLAKRSRGVVLELYSLDSRLARERARLVELRIRTAQVKGELADGQTTPARRPQHAEGLRALARDPAAAALRTGRHRPAGGRVRRLLGRRRAGQPRLARPGRRPGPGRDRADAGRRSTTRPPWHARLAAKQRHLRVLAQEASQSTLVLEQASAQRASYLATLAGQQKLNTAAIAAYQQQALAVETKAREALGRLPDAAGGTDRDRSGRPLTDGGRDRLLDQRAHRHRRPDRMGRGRSRSRA